MSRPRSPATLATMARPDALAPLGIAFWRSRTAMLQAFRAWLEQQPLPQHVEHEIEATASAMRQMVALREETP